MKNAIYRYLYRSRYILMGLGIVLFVFLPYFQPGIVTGSDDTFHLIRISSLATALKNGMFPVKFHPTLCRGYGYGVGFFYPNLFLYLPAILIVLGVSQNVAYKIFAFFIMCAIFGTTYYSSMRIKRDEKAAFLAASLFLLSNRIVGGFYLDFTIGNLLGAIFMPIAIVGIYLVLERDENPGMLVVGFCGLIYTHPISVLLTFLVCAVLALVYIKSIISNLKVLLKLIISVGMVVGISAAVWLPMLDQYRAHEMKVSRPWNRVEENVLSFRDILGTRGTNYIILVCSALTIIIILIKLKQIVAEKDKFIILSALIGILLIVLTTIRSFWVLFHDTLNIIQFPARILLPASLLICLAFGQAVSYINRKRIVSFGMLVLVAISLINAYMTYRVDIGETIDLADRVLENEIDGIGAGEEWLPVKTTREMFVDKNLAVDNNGREIYGEKSRGDSVYTFTVQEGTEYCDIPYVYYRGFVAEDKTGKQYKINDNPDTGLARVFLESIDKETIITVTFEGDFYQKCSYLCTIISLAFSMALFYIGRRKNSGGLQQL